MRNIIFTLLFLIGFCSISYAQPQQGTVEMDAIAFARDSGNFQVEIYYSILQGVLQFEQKGNSWIAPIDAHAEIWQDGIVLADHTIKKEKVLFGTKASIDSSRASLILDGTALMAKLRSNAKAALIFHMKNDKGAVVHDTIIRDFIMPIRSANKFFMGGIEFANNITPSSERTNPFEKFGYIITPNPSKVYGINDSKLSYYTELYIPQPSVLAATNCEVITRVLDANKHEMFSNSHQQSLGATVIPLVGSIDVDGLPTDSYILEIAVKRGSVVEASMQKVFFYDSGMKLSEDADDASSAGALDEETIYTSSDLSKMTELEIREKGDQAMYIGNTEQVRGWKKLTKKLDEDEENVQSVSTEPAKRNGAEFIQTDITQQRKYLYQFWRGKDKEQRSVAPLRSYRDYYANVDEVNKKFTYQKTAGWKTDMGRVYLVYGAPDQRNITNELHSINAKPYVAWNYFDKNLRLSSGSHAMFVFVDKQGGGKFVLVHSNVQGEVSEPDWYSQEALRTR